ncbi:MAG: hypothetical protein ACOC8P_00385 [Dichotomicrobium sp.]
MGDYKPTLCVDFDGVIHGYSKGWQDGEIYDDAVPGFFEWLDEAAQYFKIVVYSSRSKDPAMIDKMQWWFAEQRKKWREAGGESPITDGTPVEIEFAAEKPAAFLTIDDRCIRFDGDWSDERFSPEAMLAYKPWTQREDRS